MHLILFGNCNFAFINNVGIIKLSGQPRNIIFNFLLYYLNFSQFLFYVFEPCIMDCLTIFVSSVFDGDMRIQLENVLSYSIAVLCRWNLFSFDLCDSRLLNAKLSNDSFFFFEEIVKRSCLFGLRIKSLRLKIYSYISSRVALKM